MRKKFLQVCNTSSLVLKQRSHFVILTILFNNDSSGNVENIFDILTFGNDNIFWVIEFFCKFTVGHSCLKVLSVKDFRKLRIVDDSMILINELNFWFLHLEVEDLFIYFSSQGSSFFVFNLSFFEHLFDKVVLMSQEIILSSSMLN